jgi:signal transduction histidine kinase
MFRNLRLQSKLMALVIGPLIALVVFGSFSVVSSSRTASDLNEFQGRQAALYQAAWQTKYLDEVLTHSAARYIASKGDEKWWDRYNAAVTQLDGAIAVGKKFGSPDELKYLDEVDSANKKLIDLETEIHDLVKAGKYGEANDILAGEYDTQKVVYSGGVEKFFNATGIRVTKVLTNANNRSEGQRNVLLLLAAISAAVLGAAALFARSISRPIVEMTKAAQFAASESLPRMLAATEAGEEIPTLAKFDTGNLDEIGDLTRALDSFQDAATHAAQEQALVRRNMAETLVNLGRRNQGLLNKTLKLITNLERDERDPERLDELFKLDHLATRVRRNAESLLVLAGANSSRVSPRPVAVTDVLRSAVSEIEDYSRIAIDIEDQINLRGSVVADVAHLLAELLENATSCSPPQMPVRVTGKMGPKDYRIVIVDDGLGMSAEALVDANERVSSAPRFDARPTKSLGLHVVGRLADRHGITVRLIENVTGGLAAKVSIPMTLIMPATEAKSAPTPTNAAPVTAGASDTTADVISMGRTLAQVQPVERHVEVANGGTSTISEELAEAAPPQRPIFEQRKRGAQMFESGRPTAAPTRPAASAEQVASRLGSFQNVLRPILTDDSPASDDALATPGDK